MSHSPDEPLASDPQPGITDSTTIPLSSGNRRTRGRKPVDPRTGETVKRTPYAAAMGERLRTARIGPDTKHPRFEINEAVAALTIVTGFPWNRQTLNSYENGYAVPPVEKLMDMANLYHTSLDYLVRGDEANTVRTEQLLDKLPDSLRYAMFALHEHHGLAQALTVMAVLDEEKRASLLELVTAAPGLSADNLSLIQRLASQLSHPRQ